MPQLFLLPQESLDQSLNTKSGSSLGPPVESAALHNHFWLQLQRFMAEVITPQYLSLQPDSYLFSMCHVLQFICKQWLESKIISPAELSMS